MDSKQTDYTFTNRTMAGQVVDELGKRIIDGSYAEGQQLPVENSLAAELDVSRTVIREAVKVLTAKGIIESRPRRGIIVREQKYWNYLDPDVLVWKFSSHVSEEDINCLLELRQIIEPEAARLAALKATEEEIERIESAYQLMADTVDSDVAGWTNAEIQFHGSILRATGNMYITPLINVTSASIRTIIAISYMKASENTSALPAHKEILSAIKDGDEKKAKRMVNEMLAESHQRVHDSFAKKEK